MISRNIIGLHALSIFLIISVLLLLGNIASAATIKVPDEYTKIQWAIDNATTGDTIEVYNGIYYENVNVNKQINLKGKGSPIVNAGGSGSAIIINADGVTIEGFIAINSNSDYYSSDAGIKVNSNNSIIIDNNANNNIHGIILQGLDDSCYDDSCASHGNNITNNSAGRIIIIRSENNNITNNTIFGGFGIVYYSKYNYIKGNTVDGGIGIGDYSSGNSIVDNTVHGKISLFQCGGSNNLSSNNLNGDISVYRSDASIYNNIFDSGNIMLQRSSSADIVGNRLNSGEIFLSGPFVHADIIDNVINSNVTGISIDTKSIAIITGNTVNQKAVP
jgi:nitrous oxidase accessory protein NosD